MCGLFLVVQFHCGGSATNGAIPFGCLIHTTTLKELASPISYLQGKSVSLLQRAMQCSLLGSRPRFLAYCGGKSQHHEHHDPDYHHNHDNDLQHYHHHHHYHFTYYHHHHHHHHHYHLHEIVPNGNLPFPHHHHRLHHIHYHYYHCEKIIIKEENEKGVFDMYILS